MVTGYPIDFPVSHTLDVRFLKVHCLIRIQEICTEFAIIAKRKSKKAERRKDQLFAVFYENQTMLDKLGMDHQLTMIASPTAMSELGKDKNERKAYLLLFRTSRHYSGSIESFKIKKGKEWWRRFRLLNRDEM